MGRRRPERPETTTADAQPRVGRPAPVGAERLAWSYLATLFVALLVGLASAIAAPLIGASCDTDSMGCVLGWAIAVALVTAIAASGMAAALMKLGWEWWAVCAAVLTALPILLDVIGPGAWGIVALTPALAAGSTWTGPDRPSWRPKVIGATSLVVAVAAVLHTFVL